MFATHTAYQAGSTPDMSYFPGIVGGRSEEYAQTRPPQQPNSRYLSSGNVQHYREPGTGYVSPETISPYRSPAIQKDYSPSPSAHFPDSQFSPPTERPSLTQYQESRQQSIPARTNSIVDRMEGIEVSGNRGDATSPREGMHQRANRSGLVDGRGEGDVVMQSSVDGSANARRRYPDGRIGVLPPGESFCMSSQYRWTSYFMQNHQDHTRPSSSSATGPSEQSGYAIGHPLLRRKQSFLPCNAAQVHVRNGLGNDW